MRLSQLIQYKMNIKTNLIEEYENFVDSTNKRNKNLWLYINMLIYSVYTHNYNNILIRLYKGIKLLL